MAGAERRAGSLEMLIRNVEERTQRRPASFSHSLDKSYMSCYDAPISTGGLWNDNAINQTKDMQLAHAMRENRHGGWYRWASGSHSFLLRQRYSSAPLMASCQFSNRC